MTFGDDYDDDVARIGCVTLCMKKLEQSMQHMFLSHIHFENVNMM